MMDSGTTETFGAFLNHPSGIAIMGKPADSNAALSPGHTQPRVSPKSGYSFAKKPPLGPLMIFLDTSTMKNATPFPRWRCLPDSPPRAMPESDPSYPN